MINPVWFLTIPDLLFIGKNLATEVASLVFALAVFHADQVMSCRGKCPIDTYRYKKAPHRNLWGFVFALSGFPGRPSIVMPRQVSGGHLQA